MPERHRILIVDEDYEDRQAVINALRSEAAGVEADVLEADTVAFAREALRDESFACVFIDHDLPDGTALDLLTEVRAQGLATPIIVLTGQRDEQAILEVMRAGAADYLPKERLHPDLIARTLRAALRFLQAEREKQAVLTELRARDRAIAAASNGIVIADARLLDCPLVYTNEAFLQMTGYAEGDVIGRNCRFLQGPDTDPAAVLELREAVREIRNCQLQILNYRKDGSAFWNEVTVSPVRDVRGNLTHFVGIQTDTTARQEAHGERIQLLGLATRKAAELAVVIEAMPAGVYLGTEQGIVLSNSVGLEMLGLDSAEQLQRDIPSLVKLFETRYADTGERVPPSEEVFTRALQGESAVQEVLQRNLRTGRDLVVRSAAAPITEDGRVVGAVAVNTDMTSQKRAEEALRQYQFISDNAADAFFLMDAAGCFVYVNAAACRSLGYTADELYALRVPDVDVLLDDIKYQTLFASARNSTLPPFETQHRRADGTVFPVEASASALHVDGSPLLFCSVRDISDRKHQEEEMAALYEREHRIAESLQRSLLNTPSKRVGGLDVETIYRAAWDEALVGGDFYDSFPLDGNRLALVGGDVSGKGLQAASRTAEIKYTLRAYLREFTSSAPALKRLNSFLCEAQTFDEGEEQYFVVLTLVVVDAATGAVEIAVAGGDPPLVLRTDGGVEEVQVGGMPLGVAPKADYEAIEMQLGSGDLLLVSTDGITEARRGREFLGNNGLIRLAQQARSAGSLAEIGQAILTGAQEFASGRLHDDICLLLARRQ